MEATSVAFLFFESAQIADAVCGLAYTPTDDGCHRGESAFVNVPRVFKESVCMMDQIR